MTAPVMFCAFVVLLIVFTGAFVYLTRSFLSHLASVTHDANALALRALEVQNPVYDDPLPAPADLEAAMEKLAGVSPLTRGMPTRLERPEMYQDPFEAALDENFAPAPPVTGQWGWSDGGVGDCSR